MGVLSEVWVEQHVDDKKVRFPYIAPEQGNGIDILLTGSPEQLREFASKYAEDPKVFPRQVYKRRK